MYYACGGFVMKGASACEKFLLRKDPLEEVLLNVVRERLEILLAGDGEAELRKMIEEELVARGSDPRQEHGDCQHAHREDRPEGRRAA